VEIKESKQVKATVPAKLVPVEHVFSTNAAVIGTDGGKRELHDIQLSGKKFLLQILPQATDMNASGAGEESQY